MAQNIITKELENVVWLCTQEEYGSVCCWTQSNIAATSILLFDKYLFLSFFQIPFQGVSGPVNPSNAEKGLWLMHSLYLVWMGLFGFITCELKWWNRDNSFPFGKGKNESHASYQYILILKFFCKHCKILYSEGEAVPWIGNASIAFSKKYNQIQCLNIYY